MARKYLRGLQYTTGTNGRDIPIFMKLCYEFWAYCVNGTNPVLTVTAASNANPIVITTSTPHNLTTNQLVGVYGVQGNTNANGGWSVVVINSTQFSLSGAVGNANYTAGGQVFVPGGLPISGTSAPAGFFEGSSVMAVGNDGVTSSIGSTLTAASSAPFTIGMAGKHIVIWLAGAATGIAPASAGLSLPQTSISVSSTLGFPASGTLFILSSAGIQNVSYAGINNTTITSGSNGQALPQATINVVSTAGFPTTGTINVTTSSNVLQVVTYTGITGTTFTGCTGGTGTMSTGGAVTGQIFTACSGGTGILAPNASVSVNQPSTDDSIYRIISVPSSTQVQLQPFTGGTPDISTLKNNLTARASLCYRVIDAPAAASLSVASGNYFVGTMSGAPNINFGQASSQFQFILRGVSATFGQFGMVGSPNGSWNGSTFSGTGSNATISERTSAIGNSFNGGSANVNGFMTMFADTDYFFAHIHSSNSNGAAATKALYFMATTPERMYTQAQDPNVFAVLVAGNGLNANNGTDSVCTSFGMSGFDGVTRSYQLISRNLVGDTANASIGTAYTVGFNMSSNVGYQTKSGQVMMGDALMSSATTAGQFSFARAKMRPMKFTFGGLPTYFLVGANGEFIHLVNGILMPWDNAILPYNVLAGGL